MPTGQAERLMPTLRRVVMARQSAARTDGELLSAFVQNAGATEYPHEGARSPEAADAFAELVRRHGAMVLGVCRRVAGDYTTADDAFQATFLVLARRAASVRPRERVGSWLYGVAYRTALKARMVLARRRSREKQVDVMPEPTAPSAVPAWSDLQIVIDEELARLPDKLRLPVVLCDLEGRPQREVAKHLNVPAATLATRLASARRTLAARLTRRGVALSGGALAGLLEQHASASAVPHTLATGVVRAVESGATQGALNSLVSAQAVHLSEGVIRMMMIAKLKAVAVLAAVALALTTGLGVGLVPAAAGDQPATTNEPNATKKAPVTTESVNEYVAERLKNIRAEEPSLDDPTFLRRLSLDVRGTVPTDVETWFFVSDGDEDKRAKVVEWITDDDAKRAAIAKKLGVPIERVRVVRARLVTDDVKGVDVSVAEVVDVPVVTTTKVIETLNFTPDGKKQVVSDEVKIVRGDKVVIEKDARVNRAVVRVTDEKTAKKDDHLGVWSEAVVGSKPAKDTFFQSWTATSGDKDVFLTWASDGKPSGDKFTTTVDLFVATPDNTDAEFLKRVLTDVRGNGPTALELKYFTEDKDPKKREKLIDTLLKDPAVQKKLGDEWKKKMLALKSSNQKSQVEFFYLVTPDHVIPEGKNQNRVVPLELTPAKPFVVPLPPTTPKVPKPPAPSAKPFVVPDAPAVPAKPATPKTPAAPKTPQSDRLEKLVGELIAAQKSDEAILEAITLATLSRLPTDAEKKLVLAVASTAGDRKTAWVAVARALAGTDVKKVDVIVPQFRVELVNPAAPPAPPVPPAKP
ncbi:sigma-70 family rna polymerase sigma factor : RNA polymerase sigma factor, sigma-70 family OS=Singulisphaera acidiphila (strain ATCC BAA-1392 / DSM 18658 / VKM B-2454 / MOB10) GN=Sinac_4264 PE=4 SV=1: Sigma70_r2: Sigma70_r4_2: PSCyt2: PSCyt2 [Gemmata massiliana]|uniref:RNA polymerase sigma-70 region 2 domain-containing protein n=1 Tax=Gemmata massiliana TaxID=1210884 RepID=A0A6P2DKK0_9BACT|nr:sigma-70 family RNA polymerase sigma factor [Gemmata massiliana]VTS03180.1 sigma-70 family rna polymerase sigma factor : RNA polymerase sigma factor, sigma-70 family OS=Singulisphaera acidiphila (strain ATCC BAA-1392 / DSM 18658 / VKM B-2454 / MOB10) GN=Sinac_4264 PE=4 SV=1: Sigma70_r2: Sigma70_r4_2: PSCyt2: PSCyt2 [Gemmata massiliana]